jgi:hypothetical protein
MIGIGHGAPELFVWMVNAMPVAMGSGVGIIDSRSLFRGLEASRWREVTSGLFPCLTTSWSGRVYLPTASCWLGKKGPILVQR